MIHHGTTVVLMRIAEEVYLTDSVRCILSSCNKSLCFHSEACGQWI